MQTDVIHSTIKKLRHLPLRKPNRFGSQFYLDLGLPVFGVINYDLIIVFHTTIFYSFCFASSKRKTGLRRFNESFEIIKRTHTNHTSTHFVSPSWSKPSGVTQSAICNAVHAPTEYGLTSGVIGS